jgi:hypothetical protein
MTTIFCVRPRGFNIGNDAIFLGVRHLLGQAFGPVNIVQVAATAGDSRGAFAGLTAATVHEMNQYGDGVVVGGGNLYENNGLDVDLQALGALRPPLLLFSLSHGRIYDRHHRLSPRSDAMPDGVVRALNERACRSIVRDDATQACLERLGVTTSVVGGCPSLLLDRVDLQPAPSIPDGTLLSIRHPQLMSVPPREQARLYAAIPALIAALEADGFGPVRLLCHDLRDLPFASSLGAREFILPHDVYGYLSLLRRARLVIAFRLHAFVPCLAFGTPVVHVGYDERSTSLPRTLGLEDWNVDLIHDVDVVASVRARCADLARLASMRAAAAGRWQALHAVMTDAMADFAARVTAYAGAQRGRGPSASDAPLHRGRRA